MSRSFKLWLKLARHNGSFKVPSRIWKKTSSSIHLNHGHRSSAKVHLHLMNLQNDQKRKSRGTRLLSHSIESHFAGIYATSETDFLQRKWRLKTLIQGCCYKPNVPLSPTLVSPRLNNQKCLNTRKTNFVRMKFSERLLWWLNYIWD
jgi:hypothetical protein